MKTARLAIIGLATALAGCATPRAVLDQANHGAALTAALHAELRNFREMQVKVAASRIETIREQELRISQYQRSAAYDDRLAKAAGKSDAITLYQTLTELADSIATDEIAQQQRLEELTKRLDALVQPLPESAATLAAVQNAMAALGAELSPSDRIKLVTGFVSDVRSEIEKSREAADKEAKKAPVQPEPDESK
jgi:hypothetical protein